MPLFWCLWGSAQEHRKWLYSKRLYHLGRRNRFSLQKQLITSTKLLPRFMYSTPVFALVDVPLYPRAYICSHRPEQAEKQSCLGHHEWQILFNCPVSSTRETNRNVFPSLLLLSISMPLCHERRKCLFTQKPTGLADCHPSGNGQGWGRSIAICTHS